MSVNGWLCVSFTVPSVVAYVLWCADRMPRMQRLMGVAGFLAFVVALVIDGFFE